MRNGSGGARRTAELLLDDGQGGRVNGVRVAWLLRLLRRHFPEDTALPHSWSYQAFSGVTETLA